MRWISIVLLVLLSAASAWAQASYQERRQAEALAREAAVMARQNRLDDALDNLIAADALDPQPSYKVQAAEVLERQGELIGAADMLRQAASANPRQWNQKQAVKRAKKLLGEIEDKTPTIEIEVESPSDGTARITVEGEPFDPDEGPQPFNPGSYQVEARADGYQSSSQSLELEPGDRASLTISLDMSASPAGEEEVEEEADEGGGLPVWPAVVAWSVGGVGLLLGTGFGIAAITSTNAVIDDYDCKNNRCPKKARDDLDTALLNGDISTAGFIIGGVGVAAGTVLWILADPGADEEPAEAASGIELRPWVGPMGAGVAGSF